jgi:hypothetical protein
MDKIVDGFIIYQLMKRLVTPFEKSKAFQFGIIDKDGNILKKRKDLSADEKAVWGYTDIAVNNLKRVLANVPGGKTMLVSAAAAAWLLKEDKVLNVESLTAVRSDFTSFLNNSEQYYELAEYITEDEVPANNIGAGKIEGAGVGEKGEPGGRKSLVSRLKMVRRRANGNNKENNMGA